MIRDDTRIPEIDTQNKIARLLQKAALVLTMWSGVVGSGREWLLSAFQTLSKMVASWSGVVKSGSEVVGSGRKWSGVVGSGRKWSGAVGSGREWPASIPEP